MTGALCRCIPEQKQNFFFFKLSHCNGLFCQNTDQPADVRNWMRTVQFHFKLTWCEPCVSFWRTITVQLMDVLPQYRVTAKHNVLLTCTQK